MRATLDCGPPRLLRDWESLLTVRRPKPLIPLTTAPLRVSINSKNSLPPVKVRIAKTTPNANTGAVMRINANETNSFAVIAFMRHSLWRAISRASVASRVTFALTTSVPLNEAQLFVDLSVSERGRLSPVVYKSRVTASRWKGHSHQAGAIFSEGMRCHLQLTVRLLRCLRCDNKKTSPSERVIM